MSGVIFYDFQAADVAAIDLQPSQWVEAGIDMRALRDNPDYAPNLERAGRAWSARAGDGRLLCCAGIAEQFKGRHGVAWAMLAANLGAAAYLAITRFARAQIAASPLKRIDALVTAEDDGRAAAWAKLCGFTLNTVMHHWGAAGDSILLYERLR